MNRAALVVWGACGWSIVVPQLHRLIGRAPALAPLLSALNATTVYLGASVAAVVGALGISTVGAYQLGPVGAAAILLGLGFAELARRAIDRRTNGSASPAVGSAAPPSRSRPGR